MGVIGVLFFIYPALVLAGITGCVIAMSRFRLFSSVPAGVLWAYVFLRMAVGTVDSSEDDAFGITLAVLSVAMCIAAACYMAWFAAEKFPQSFIDVSRFYLVHRKFRFLSCLGIQLVIGGLILAILFSLK